MKINNDKTITFIIGSIILHGVRSKSAYINKANV